MKVALKLVVLYILMQILAVLTIAPIDLLVRVLAHGEALTPETTLSPWTVVPTLLLGMAYMTLYLWRHGYLTDDGLLYCPTTPRFLGLTLLAGVSAIYLVDNLMNVLSFLPDFTRGSFVQIESTWVGIAAVVLIGPVFEELLFRGAITRELLRRYPTWMAIVVSALLFGVAHLNPVQAVCGFLLGILLAWVYVRTGSLLPGLLIHVVNNGLSASVDAAYPGAETMSGLLPMGWRVVGMVVAVVVLVVALRRMNSISRG